ncbi:hypothetical protein [Falsochrobactrum shanghaiense]|uniref:hypothetical protein n=1 Tax=Falsochrobactrum shanghaiense TaxID=2201899 RepID=UPI001FE0D1D1|nr:hypothetical protein [Falsochrobactrum shanghaiense]
MADTYVPKNYNADGGDTSVFGGVVQFTGLPTSAPSGSGQLWSDGGTLKISAVHVAPANTVAPAITGTATVGQTLTVTNGTWTGTPTPTYARQWYADDVAIEGATATTYALTAAEEGAVITVVVTATNAAGSVTAASNATVPVATT